MKITLNTQKVKVILAHKNKTYTWLAVQINTTPQYVSAIMGGHKHPSPGTRLKIQRVLNGYRWDDLFCIQHTTTSEGVSGNE